MAKPRTVKHRVTKEELQSALVDYVTNKHGLRYPVYHKVRTVPELTMQLMGDGDALFEVEVTEAIDQGIARDILSEGERR